MSSPYASSSHPIPLSPKETLIFSPRHRNGPVEIRAKEVILVCLALLLLVFSVSLFFKHWKKNYWDINQLPYYAYLYKVLTISISLYYLLIEMNSYAYLYSIFRRSH